MISELICPTYAIFHGDTNLGGVVPRDGGIEDYQQIDTIADDIIAVCSVAGCDAHILNDRFVVGILHKECLNVEHRGLG